jgi:hypothetical protein
MALSNSVKQFFINRIHKVLEDKIKEVRSKIDQNQVKDQAYYFLVQKTGNENLFSEYDQVIANLKDLEKREETLRHQISKTIKANIGSSPSNYYRNDTYADEIRDFAVRLFGKDAATGLYPEYQAEIERLEALMPDVEGAVLLSTTEPNLRYALTQLLQRYGGDLSSIENMIPSQLE